MQEETTQRTIALAVKTGKLTEEVLKKVMLMYLNERGHPGQELHGKISVRNLMGLDQGAQTMEIGNGSIKTFDRVARKYNITYSVQKDKTQQPPKYIVFFRGKDQYVLARAFADYLKLNEKKQNKVSVIKKLKGYREAGRNAPDKERQKEKHKDRESSL